MLWSPILVMAILLDILELIIMVSTLMGIISDMLPNLILPFWQAKAIPIH